MSVYRRYFIIKDEPTLLEIDKLFKKRTKYREKIKEIEKEVGAWASYFDAYSGQFSGFGFKSPDRINYRSVTSGIYYPKKSSKTGREIAKRLSDIKCPEVIDEALRVSGLIPGFSGAYIDGLSFYRNTICGSETAGWFATVPWQDVDPSELEAYKATHKGEGVKEGGNLSHLLWSPPKEWEEVKEWHVKKALKEAEE